MKLDIWDYMCKVIIECWMAIIEFINLPHKYAGEHTLTMETQRLLMLLPTFEHGIRVNMLTLLSQFDNSLIVYIGMYTQTNTVCFLRASMLKNVLYLDMNARFIFSGLQMCINRAQFYLELT